MERVKNRDGTSQRLTTPPSADVPSASPERGQHDERTSPRLTTPPSADVPSASPERARTRDEAIAFGKAKVAKVVQLLGAVLAKRGRRRNGAGASVYVHQLMTRKPRVCAPSDTLQQAAAIMWDTDCGCVPVVDGQSRPIAMITDRDICMGAYTQGRSLPELPVSSAASRKIVSLQEGEPVEAAEALMQKHRIRRLCIVGADGRLVGILSMGDLARHAKLDSQGRRISGSPASWSDKDGAVDAASVARTLAAISTPTVRQPPRLES
jgi:CBS domain-containing protein